MEPMLGISIGIDPIWSGFVHDSFLLLVEQLLAYQHREKSIIWFDLDSNRRTTAPGQKPSSSEDIAGSSTRIANTYKREESQADMVGVPRGWGQ